MRRWTFALPLAALLAALVASPSAARAGDAKAEAQALLNEGNQLAIDGEHPAALEKFREAYARYPSPKLLLNIGTTLRHMGRNAEAAASYEAYLRHPEADPKRTAEVRRLLAEIDALVGRVRIEHQPPTSTVRLDGKPIAGTGGVAQGRADPGEHVITVEKPGMSTAVKSVTLAPRTDVHLTIQLTPPDQKPIVVVYGPSARRTAGLVLGGIGAAALIAGGVTGVLAKTTANAVAAHCSRGGPSCDDEGARLSSAAHAYAGASTATFIAGGAVFLAGGILFLTAPSLAPRSGAAPWRFTAGAASGGAFASLAGSF